MRGWVSIALATLAYLVAVVQRTSMGVASLEASERFHTNASQLASLAVLQLVVYAAMQIPVGIALDRFGARAMLFTGALIMALGQLLVAHSSVLETAISGRMLVGMGDAFTFISMIRMSNNWLSGKQAALAQQWLATLGQTGQIISAFPFAFALHQFGWSSAFTALAAIGVMVAIAVIAGAKDSGAHGTSRATSLREVITALRKNARRAPVQMAFWTHFVTQSAGTTFALLWGIPFLVEAQAKSHQFASFALTLFAVTNATLGPAFGSFVSRKSDRRVPLVVTVIGITAASVLSAISWPGEMPDALVLLMVVALGFGGPASMIAFDFSRSYVAQRELGASNGLINTGGFLAALTMMFLVGLALDTQHALNPDASLFSSSSFRIAFATELLVILVGAIGFLKSASRTMQTEGHRD